MSQEEQEFDTLLAELESAFEEPEDASTAAATASPGAAAAQHPTGSATAAPGTSTSDEEAAADSDQPPAKRARALAEPPAGPSCSGHPPHDRAPTQQAVSTAGAAAAGATAAGAAAGVAAAGGVNGSSSISDGRQQQRRRHSALLELSDLLLLRVLANLSPEDLLVLAQTCRHLAAAAADATLWRRLYFSRWQDGPQSEDAEHVQGCSWKRLYLERDGQAVLQARDAAPCEVLTPLYLQMATARRSEALSAADAEGLYRSPVNSRSLQLSTKVDAFRRQRGLLDAGQHACHSCKGGCSWAQLDNDAWICDKSGFVHVCNAECGFRELDPSNDMLVCTISGRCFANMLTDAEEHAGEAERGLVGGDGQRMGPGGEGQEEEWGGDEGISGRLGRAFYAGYNAETPEDLFRWH